MIQEVISGILNNLTTFVPIILLFFLVNLSEKNRTIEHPEQGRALGVISYILIILSYLTTFLVGVGLHLLGAFMDSPLGREAKQNMVQNVQGAPFDITKLVERFDLIGLGLWVPSLLAMLVLIPAIYRALARLIPYDPFRRVHIVSLSMSFLIFLQMFVMVGMGLDLFIQMIGSQPTSEAFTFSSLWSQDILLALLSLIGVGWLTRRNGSESLQRLGLVKPTGNQLLIGLGMGIGLAALLVVMEMTLAPTGLTVDREVEELTEQLLGPLFQSVPGILTLGLAAAIGEETIFRGALQPRFGIFFTTLLFALVHANYGLTISTVIVLIVGFALGWARNRYNTTTSMVIHATYNISLGIIGVLFQ